jgi:copper chaperone CopZ
MRLRLTIDGMRAVHAKRAVFTALGGVEGVRSAEVEMGQATVECDGPLPLREGELRAAIELAGYRLIAIVRELPTL